MNTLTDLISCFDDADLAQLILNADTATRAVLIPLIGEDKAAALVAAHSPEAPFEAAPAGLTLPPDPDLPEIVLVHGITDCHLADVAKRRNRIWLDLFELVKGRYSKRLTLQSDGVSDAPGVTMRTDGHVEKKYNKALDAWTTARFRNRVFCYDWRRSVTAAADDLAAQLRALDSVKQGRKAVLVCHSMGGLVAAAFAARHPDWQSLVEHAVFVGSPLSGSYSVPVTILGLAPSFHKLDRFSIFESLEDFQRMAASFAGLVDMLPHPQVFPEAADLYTQAGWPGEIKPSQRLLDASRELKYTILASPIFASATHLVSQGIDTTAAMPWNADHTDRDMDHLSKEGDGAALNLSSLVPGLKAYLVTGEHGTLVNEPSVIDAVMKLAKGEALTLKSIGKDDLTGAVSTTQPGSSLSGLSVDPAEISDRKLGQGLALHFASEDAVAARTSALELPGFDRETLRETAFSWQNALSLALASDEAYSSDKPATKSLALGRWGFKGYQHFEKAGTQGFVAWDDHAVLLSFRGSEKKVADWLRNLTITSHDTGAGQYGKVHKGFYEAYKVVEDQILAHLKSAAAASKVIHVTGHSLGGALAIIAGAELVAKFPGAKFCFYTYGQPKLGRSAIEDFYQQKHGGRYFRFRNNDDIVTRVPPNFSHFGELYWFDRKGELKNPALAGLAATLSPESGETGDELNQAQFKALQQQLDEELAEPTDPNALYLPPTDAQIQAFRIPGFSVKDHAIRDSYIPIIKKYV
ncbi:alpha/beta fold hydrolase [Phragmitibacter flavus]|uniref:Alpha/beta fold hydrolase n=1 Tax=Phragmitibacter flavus TaxID=2576071 RepID=A0A5R8KJA9_9BACT|nr:alpha/beta fold hydrolase [Phragmitibacter flavus]TLD71709.1 alpha/beta fold hydrolase [Phragmitibacter flavus]